MQQLRRLGHGLSRFPNKPSGAHGYFRPAETLASLARAGGRWGEKILTDLPRHFRGWHDGKQIKECAGEALSREGRAGGDYQWRRAASPHCGDCRGTEPG
jgi:hypothetical protein